MTITNVGDSIDTYRVDAAPLTAQSVPDEAEVTRSWFTLPQNPVTLKPGHKKRFALTLTVPEGAPRGRYGVVVRVEPIGVAGRTGVSLSFSVGSRITFDVV